jgi:hypothetical protein
MKWWYGLLAVLLAPPTFGDDDYPGWPTRYAPHGELMISVHNVEKRASEFADWTTTFGAPEGNYEIRKLLLCQNRPWGVPNTEPQVCYPLIWARSLDAKVGYIRLDASYPGVKVNDTTAWYRVTRKWNSRLVRRVTPSASLSGENTSQSAPPPDDTWRAPIPGNRWDDPRYEERKDK